MAALTAALITTAVVSALAAGGSAVQANQATQHAKGAAEAQKTANDAQLADAAKTDAANKDAQATRGSTTQQAAIAALRASMSASSNAGGTILTGPEGTGTGTPTATKSLLGV